MLRLVLIGVLLALGLLITIDRARQHGSNRPVAALAAPPPRRPAPAGSPGASAPRLVTAGPLPNALSSGNETPTIDMFARLAIRRRLEREGTHVYLDSMLAHTDSVLTRWADRSGAPITVGFVIDSTLPGWSPALLDDARAGMRAWSGNEAGLEFREANDPDSAEIRVRWVVMLSDSGRAGSTALTWGADGIVRSAAITLALRQNPDSAQLPASARQRVAAHEFGHALGLPHSDRDGDLMYGSAPTSGPSGRDQATLLLLYAVPPGPLRIPQ